MVVDKTEIGLRSLVLAHVLVYAATLVAAFLFSPFPIEVLLVSVCLGALLIALSAIDFQTMRLPDPLTYAVIASGLVCVAALGWGDTLWHGVAAVAGFLSFYLIGQVYVLVRKHPGLGMGDAKLFAGAGAWLGLHGLPSVALLAVGCMVVALTLSYVTGRNIGARTRVPFGPALTFAHWLVWLFGPVI